MDLSVCTSMRDIQERTARDAHLQELKAYVIKGWPHQKEDIQKYWPIRHGFATIDSMAIKGKSVIIPSQLQMQTLRLLNSNHMGIEKTQLLACEPEHWVNMNADIENAVKQCFPCLEYQNTQPQEKTIPYEVPAKP